MAVAFDCRNRGTFYPLGSSLRFTLEALLVPNRFSDSVFCARDSFVYCRLEPSTLSIQSVDMLDCLPRVSNFTFRQQTQNLC